MAPPLRLVPVLALLLAPTWGSPASGPPDLAPVEASPAASQEVYSLQQAYDRLLRWGRRARLWSPSRIEERSGQLRERLEGARLRARAFPVRPDLLRPAGATGGAGDPGVPGPDRRPGWTYCVVSPDWSGEAFATGVPAGCTYHGLPVDLRLPRWSDLFQLVGEDCRTVVATERTREPVVRNPRPVEGCMRGLLVRLWDPTGRLATELEGTEGPVSVDVDARIRRAGLTPLFSGIIRRGWNEPYTLIAAFLELEVVDWERSR